VVSVNQSNKIKIMLLFLALIPLLTYYTIEQIPHVEAYGGGGGGGGGKPDPRVCGDRLCSDIPGGREAWESAQYVNKKDDIVSSLSSPKHQIKNGVDPHDIQCKEGLTLIFKKSWSPACVKISSVQKLVELGWASSHDPHHKKTTPLQVFFTLQGDDKVGSLNNLNWNAGPQMTYVSISNDANLILATSSASDSVFVFDNNGDQLASVGVGETPKGIKIHPSQNIAFAANENSGTISVIDLDSFDVIKEIPVGLVPHNIVFYPSDNRAYITIQGEDEIAVIDTIKLEKIDSIPVDKLPHNADISPDGRTLYVANIGTNDVAVIDLETKKIIKRIKISQGHHGIDVTNDGKRIYVSGIGSDKVNVIDAASLELIKQIDVGVGPHGIRSNPAGTEVFVGITKTNEIVVIDSQSLDVKEKIPVGKVPFWIAIQNSS